jgi:hypothetical protein
MFKLYFTYLDDEHFKKDCEEIMLQTGILAMWDPTNRRMDFKTAKGMRQIKNDGRENY